MKRLVLLVACLACLFVESSTDSTTDPKKGHYKGGSMTWWVDKDNPNKVIIFYRLNFRHHYQNDYLHEACTNDAIESRTILSTEGSIKVGGELISWAKYICTDYDVALDWSAGYYNMSYTLQQGTTRVDVNYPGCCWPSYVANNKRNGRGFNLVSTIDITPRPDTKQPNHPPVSDNFPIYKLRRGCDNSHYIMAWDADGDILRCRWTIEDRNECNKDAMSTCGRLSQATLLTENCKITFKKHSRVGTYAMAVMVEDFAPLDPNTPLSRIPVQFLIEVYEEEGQCRNPTLSRGEDGTCTTIRIGSEMQIELKARSTSSQNTITSFETIKPSGVKATPISEVPGTDNEYSVTLSWVPTRDQIGRHVICYRAEEDDKYFSEKLCIYIKVAAELSSPIEVVPNESVPSPGTKLVGDTVTVTYSKQIHKASQPAFISILDASNTVLFQVDSSSSSDVTLSGRSLTFNLPYDLPMQRGSSYTLRVDQGASKSTMDCEAAPQGDQWSFVFESFCDSDYSPLVVSRAESVPAPDTEMSGNIFSIAYNQKIQKPTSSAHITIVSIADDSAIFAVDTASDAVTIKDNSLTFLLPDDAAVSFGKDYWIVVDAGAARSVRECDKALPAGAKWQFKYVGEGGIRPPDKNRTTKGNLDCRENFMQTFVPKLLVGDIDPSTMYLNERECTGRDYNQTHYVIGTSYDACKTAAKVADNENFMIFENVVHIPPEPYTPGSEITRKHFIEIHLSCQLRTDRVNYLSFDPNVTTIIKYEKGYGTFVYSLRMFEDQRYSRAYTGQEFPVAVQQNQPMNFEGRVQCEGNCEAMIDTCWATPTSNPFDATRYPFITNGCPIDDTVQLLDSPSSREERFAINSFAFLGDNIHGVVYMHCDMMICDASDTTSRCTKECNKRGKRDVNSAGSSSAAYPSIIGQLKLDNRK